MITHLNGDKLVIRRNGKGYRVEFIKANGNIANVFDCDNMAEARAALHYGPDRW